MLYNSTQNSSEVVSAAQAIAQGISKDGGLFVPQEFPKFNNETFKALLNEDYKGRAKKVFSAFLTDFTKEEIDECVEKVYTAEKFGGANPAPMVYSQLGETPLNILELWHGPTCAFKDVALQMLPHLMTASVKKTGLNKKICILTATSGDTGKAALEGFKDLPGTEIIVFYPTGGVSEAQKLQMVTTDGSNTHVIAVDGCFDDAQTGVKNIFGDEQFKQELDAKKPIIVCGDMNVAHEEIDIKNPKANRMNAGFTDQERAQMTQHLNAGFIDTFRHFYPTLEGAYSWWSYSFKAREKNAGWRIDYFLVSSRLADRLEGASIHNEIFGSDHCPVEVVLK